MAFLRQVHIYFYIPFRRTLAKGIIDQSQLNPKHSLSSNSLQPLRTIIIYNCPEDTVLELCLKGEVGQRQTNQIRDYTYERICSVEKEKGLTRVAQLVEYCSVN